MTELPEKVACYWGAEYFAATKGPFPLPSHSRSWVASCTTQNRSRPRERSQPAIPTRTFGEPQDLRSRRPFRDSQLIPTFCSAERQHTSSGSARESSYLTRGQHYDDCRCSTLEGARSRSPDASCAQLGSATRARDTVRSPGRCSLNDMHLFSTPLYITRQAPPCVLPIIIFCHD